MIVACLIVLHHNNSLSISMSTVHISIHIINIYRSIVVKDVLSEEENHFCFEAWGEILAEVFSVEFLDVFALFAGGSFDVHYGFGYGVDVLVGGGSRIGLLEALHRKFCTIAVLGKLTILNQKFPNGFILKRIQTINLLYEYLENQFNVIDTFIHLTSFFV